MADFSDEACLDIKNDPLQPRVAYLRHSLRTAIEVKAIAFPTTEKFRTDGETSSDSKDAISDLIIILQGHKVAKKLRTRSGEAVNSELALLYRRIIAEHADVKRFLPLAKLVAHNASDVDTWKAVLLLGSSMELYVFDRSGAYGATPFDIHEEPERFVRAMSGYVLMSDNKLALDTFIECENGRQYVTLMAYIVLVS